MTIVDLKPGQTGIVMEIRCKGELRRRIIDMGITRGVKVMLKRTAPFGDPIQINVRGYELSIRKSDAENIEIENLERK